MILIRIQEPCLWGEKRILFDAYVGIDYSGKGSPLKGYPEIQVFEAQAAGHPSRNQVKWSRKEVFNFLGDRLKQQQNGLATRMIIGMDHGFSLPESYFLQHNLSSWSDFLEHFNEVWGYSKNRQLFTAQTRATFSYRNQNELRLTEKFTSSAKSVFNFQGITVAFSTHTGIPWLYELRQQFGDVLHFWPFDGLEVHPGKSVIAEVYPSLFYRRYSYPTDLGKRDARDAYATALWLQEQDANGTLGMYLGLSTLRPQQIETALQEGWILGVL